MADLKISQLNLLETISGNEIIPVAKDGENYGLETAKLAKQTDLESLNTTVTQLGTTVNQQGTTITEQGKSITTLQNDYNTLSEEVDKLKYGVGYVVASYTEGELDPEPGNAMGDLDLCKAWYPFLIDCTPTEGIEAVTPIGELKKNNYLRFVDGTFAPTVGISEEMRAYCDAALYLNNEGTYTQYCAAGEFNAETFYNEYGMNTLLYTQDEGGTSYTEVPHILRPWETTETKYSIVLARKDTICLLDQMKGHSGMIWKGIFQGSTVWDGIDVSPWTLPPTGISPCPVTTIGNATRSFFFAYDAGDDNCKNSAGEGDLCTMFQNGRTYPRVTDVNQNTIRTYARANNTVSSDSYPFSEGGFLAYNAFITSQEVLFKTKYLHNNNLFGSGISSNDACTDEVTWKANGGVRSKLTSGSDWTYERFNAQPANIYYSATQQRTTWNITLNREQSKEQCMESQMVASFAVETGVAVDTDFEFYGATYSYSNITGVEGLNDGEMNCKICKIMSQTFNAYDSTGAQQSFDVEVSLRMSLINGANLSGNIFAYWGGGIEVVGTCKYLQDTQRNGNLIDFYIQPDQKLWHNDSTVSVTSGNSFSWEESYMKLNENPIIQVGDGYSAKRQSLMPYSLENGGGLSTGECFYGYQNNYWGNVIDSKFRIGLRTRGYALYALCSSRALAAYYAASTSARNIGGSAQVLLNAVSLQAQQNELVL